MGVRVPNHRLTQRIGAAVRDGVSLECACRDLGIDPVTLQAWVNLGLKVEPKERGDDPFGRFVIELQRAMEEARSPGDAGLVANGPLRGPERIAPRQPVGEPNHALWDWEADERPLAWQVVRVAPVVFDFGATTARSEPAWDEPSVVSSEVGSMPVEDRTASASDSDADSEEVAEEPCIEHRNVPIEVIVAIRVVGVAVLIAVILLVIALILITMAVFVGIGLVRMMLALAYRWRAGVIALRGAGADNGLWPVAGTRQSSMSPSLRWRPLPERSLGAIALTGRNWPQRE